MKKIIILMCATALLSSCHIYKSYDRPEDITVEGLYRDTIAGGDTLAADTANFGNLPWKEVFTDAQLQTLIEQALTNNADLRSAALTVKQAQAALMSARLAYAPMLALSPQGTVSSFDKGKATQTYSLPVTASWQIDLFGQLLNPKRKAQVSLKQTQFYEQAVQTQVIANVANMYYTLLMLDRQLQISESTCDILKRNLETVEAMKEAAMANSAAVEQSRTAYAQVLASLPDIRQSIRETENALCLMLNQPAQSIARGTLKQQQLPAEFSTGIPLQLLSNRPDVKAAEMSLAASYYDTNSARAAFYPQITLSGSAGWTNSAGSAIINPGKLLASAIGSLTQPLFYRGANIARLKQAKAQEEQAKIQFQTTLLKAAAGLLPHTGQCLLDGVPLESLSTRRLAQTVSYIPQQSGISVSLSAREVVLMGFNPRLGVLQNPTAAMRAAADEALRTVGLADKAGQDYLTLSGGEKQLCILARTIAEDAPLLLLDEPDSALDLANRSRMTALLAQLVHTGGKTALVCLHDPALALDSCDILVVLQGGGVAAVLHPRTDPPAVLQAALAAVYGPLELLPVTDCRGRRRLALLPL